MISKTDQQLATLQELVRVDSATTAHMWSKRCNTNIFKVSNIEFAQLEQSIIYGLTQGNQVLKQIHRETSLERVEHLMEETAESQTYQRVRAI